MSALALSFGIAIIYLVVLRFLDLNEREPLWAVALLFAAGLIAGAVINLAVPSAVLELTVLRGAIAQELSRFLAIALGLGIVATAGRARGWSELNGPMDGIVYGAAAGLGFATGNVLARELMLQGGLTTGLEPQLFALLGGTALAGLAHGVFGAISGAALAAAALTRSPAARLTLPLAGLLAAVFANAGYRLLAFGGALGAGALVRTWLALALPVLLLLIVAVRALVRERRTIIDELEAERDDGAVTSGDLELLKNHVRRQGAYWSALLKGRFAQSAALRSLHNRQVQLALARRRANRARDEAAAADVEAEVELLRAAVHDRRKRVDALAEGS